MWRTVLQLVRTIAEGPRARMAGVLLKEGRKVQGKLRKLLMISGGHASIDIMTVDERSGSQEVFLDLVFLSNLTKRTRASHLVM